ncbi:MAG: DNA methyltransferase, partial [Candidatus Woesearchaeota archaeon]
MYALILSKENIILSKTEAKELLEIKEYSLIKNILICNINKKNLKKINRLSYTKKILDVLFICDTKNLEESLLNFNFKKHYKKNFCLRIHNIPDKKSTSNYETKKEQNKEKNEAYYSKYIWRNLELNKIKPKVNLEKPETLFEIINYKRKSLICKTVWINNNKYNLRKAHLRPEKHPTSMHPRLAAALINILNPKENEIIIDPFCGSGGILLEAKIMGLKAIGYDVD